MIEFSIIMQTKLLRQNAEEKLLRAVHSVLGQKTKCRYELIIVCDGCQKSYDAIVKEFAVEFKGENQRLKLYMIDGIKTNRWRSSARNVGISKASGKWILYLDNDDYYTNNYLKRLCELDPVNDWYTVDDLTYKNGWNQRRCNLKLGHCGTSNIIHKRSMFSRWPEIASYGKEDYKFIQNLLHESKKYVSLSLAGYCVCHIPGQYEV